jgi:FkbM family methyltransferase
MPNASRGPAAAAAWFRFRPSWSWVEHVWKSTWLQDHAALGATLRGLGLPRDGVALDIGAHGGQVTRLLADLLPAGQVVAVEPSSYARSVLRLNLLVRARPNVTVVAAALGREPGVAVLATPVKRAGAMGYGIASLVSEPGRGTVWELVPVTTVDALVAAMELPALHLMKIDVEGYETAILQGALETLRRCRPALVLELARERLARAGSSPEELWALLASMGYGAQALPAPRPDRSDGDWLFRVPGLAA